MDTAVDPPAPHSCRKGTVWGTHAAGLSGVALPHTSAQVVGRPLTATPKLWSHTSPHSAGLAPTGRWTDSGGQVGPERAAKGPGRELNPQKLPGCAPQRERTPAGLGSGLLTMVLT